MQKFLKVSLGTFIGVFAALFVGCLMGPFLGACLGMIGVCLFLTFAGKN